MASLIKGCRSIKEVTWNGETSFIESDVIEWPHLELERVERSLPSSGSLKGWNVPSLRDKLLEANLLRLKATLTYWESIPIRKVLDSSRIIRRNILEGPSFADEMDDQIKYTLRYKTTTCVTYSDNWDIDIVDSAKGIDSFFPPCHLLPFRRPETQDIDLIFGEPKNISEALLSKFEINCRKYLKEGADLPFLDDLDRLSLFGGTKTFDPTTGRSGTRTGQRLKDPSLELTDAFKFKYVFVQKTASEDRAAVIADQETLNTLRLLKISLEAVRCCPTDCMPEKDFSYLERWLSRSGCQYLMSDQKKCGLTFPRLLLKRLFKVLKEMYPNSVFEKGYNAMDNTKVLLKDGSWKKQTCGTNLGMLNEYISFISSVLVSSWIEEEGIEDVDAKMYNDDQIIRFGVGHPLAENLQARIDTGKAWDSYMDSHGLSVHTKKPYWSDSGVFLEIYGHSGRSPFNHMKRSQYVGNIFWSMLGTTVVEAKQFVSGIIDNLPESYLPEADRALPSLVNLFPFEFFSGEERISYPIGWYKRRNDLGQYTILDEVYRLKEPLFSKVCSVLATHRDSKYNSELKKLKASFNSKYSWFINELKGKSSPAFIRRLGENLVPAFLGVRKHDFFVSYKNWEKKRKEAFFFQKKPPLWIDVVKEMTKINCDIAIPYERPLNDMTGEPIDYRDLGDEYTSLTLRTYISVAKLYGQFKDILISHQVTEEDIKRVAKFFESCSPHSAAYISMLGKYEREKLQLFFFNNSYGTGTVSEKLLEQESDYRFLDWIPGEGYCVAYSEEVKSIYRYRYDDYKVLYSTYGTQAPLLLS
jgi:hypothetical protein